VRIDLRDDEMTVFIEQFNRVAYGGVMVCCPPRSNITILSADFER
jgi:hypothetical protein